MSHFVGLVVGANVQSQLEKYDERIGVEPYITGTVSEEEKAMFVKHYQEEYGLSNQTFEQLYAEHGEDWNGNDWKPNEQGVWENWSTYNPDSKWDWYEVGGRWDGYFTLKNGKKANVCRKRDIDLKAMTTKSYEKAINYYNTVANCFPDGKIPKVETLWKDLFHIDNLGERGKVYHNQPALLALQKAQSNKELTQFQRDLLNTWEFDLEDFNDLTAEQYAEIRARESFVPHVIVINGEWIQKGRMGWFGISKDEDENWTETFYAIWDKIHYNSLITAIDFHI